METRYLTQSEAAEYLRVSVRFLRQETTEGRITGYRVGRRLLYKLPDLDEYVGRGRTKPGEDMPATD